MTSVEMKSIYDESSYMYTLYISTYLINFQADKIILIFSYVSSF